MKQLSWRVKLLPQVWSCLFWCPWGMTYLFQFGIYSLCCGNNVFLKGNWKVCGDATDIFLFLDSQIPTIHAVHTQISVALYCSIVWKLLWGVSFSPGETARSGLLHTCIPTSAHLCACSTRTCGGGVTLRSPRGKKGKNTKVKAILVQVFCWVFSTPKCWLWSKFYLMHFRRTGLE